MTIPVERKRTFAPKTRTGCRTCRFRRVKCDEARPTCRKCTSTGRKCDGYELNVRPTCKASSNDRSRKLLPLTPVETTLVMLPASCGFVSGLNEIEIQAFDFFRTKTSGQLVAALPSSMWIRTAMQMSLFEPSLLHAISAVGAMHRARAQITKKTLHVVTSRDAHYNTAVNRYCKALSYLQCYMNDEKQLGKLPIEVVLIACLLFTMYEMLQGDRAMAITHFKNGLQIVKQRYAAAGIDYEALSKGMLIKSTPDSELDNLLGTFVQLDYHATMFGERSPYFALIFEADSLNSRIDIPDFLSSISEAELHLSVISNATYRLRSELVNLAERDACKMMNPADDWTRWTLCCESLSRTTELTSQMHLYKRWKDIEKAHEKFKLSLDDLRAVAPPSIRISLNLMEIQRFANQLMCSTFRITTDMYFDHLEPEFARAIEMKEEFLQQQHVLEYCKELETHAINMPDGKSAAWRTFDLEPCALPAMYMIGTKCRNSSLRRRAIDILYKLNRQGSLYDSGNFCAYVKRIQELEEERAKAINPSFDPSVDYEASAIPEAARFVDVVLSGVVEKPGWGRLTYSRFKHETNGELEVFNDEFDAR